MKTHRERVVLLVGIAVYSVLSLGVLAMAGNPVLVLQAQTIGQASTIVLEAYNSTTNPAGRTFTDAPSVRLDGDGGGEVFFPSVTPLPPSDTTPPVISNVTVLLYSSLITITWNTNEISDSVVKWGKKSGDYTVEKSDPTPDFYHSIRLEEIKDEGTYYFVVMSTDPSGNVAQTLEHHFILTTTLHPIDLGWIGSFLLMLILSIILGAIPVVIILFVIYMNKERAEELKQKTDELKRRVEEFKKLRAKVLTKQAVDEFKDIRSEVVTKQGAEDFKEIKEKAVSGIKASEKKGRETALSLSINRIRDVIREKRDLLTIKYIDNQKSTSPKPKQGLPSEQLLTTHLSADGDVLDKVERKLVTSLRTHTFKVYVMPDKESIGKDVKLEKGLLKVSNKALWIISRDSLTRIAGEDIVYVEQLRKSNYQGTEYGAISIEYLNEPNTSVVSTIVITKGNTTEVLLKHILELADAYKLTDKLLERENQILRMMHAGTLDLSLSKLASTAQALRLSEEELKNHLKHLNELGVIDLANQRLRKKGINYLLSLSKDTPLDG